MAIKTEGEFIPMNEIVERSGLTRQRIDVLARQGRIPHEQPGRFRIFKRRDVEKWLREREALAATRVEAA
jgi:excisionase family DNA binding protein